MTTPDFSRSRLDGMIDLRHPLAVLATRMQNNIEAALAPVFALKAQDGRNVAGEDLFGPTLAVAGIARLGIHGLFYVLTQLSCLARFIRDAAHRRDRPCSAT